MLLDNEVIIIRGARAHCDYTGYLDTFEYKHVEQIQEITQIIAIDAMNHPGLRQY